MRFRRQCNCNHSAQKKTQHLTTCAGWHWSEWFLQLQLRKIHGQWTLFIVVFRTTNMKQICKRRHSEQAFPWIYFFSSLLQPWWDCSDWVNVSIFSGQTYSLRALSTLILACLPSDSPSSLLRLWSCRSRPGSLPGGEPETRSRCHPLADRWRTNHRSHGGASLGRGQSRETLNRWGPIWLAKGQNA